MNPNPSAPMLMIEYEIRQKNPDPSAEIAPGTYKDAWVQYENGSLTLDGCFSVEEVRAILSLIQPS